MGGGQVPHKQLHKGRGIARLLLADHIGALPSFKGRCRVGLAVSVRAVPLPPGMCFRSSRGRHDEGDRLIPMLQQREGLTIRSSVAQGHVGLFPTSPEFLEAQLFNDEFHPGLGAVLAVTQGVEDLDHGLDGGNELIHGDELVKNLTDAGRGSETAAHAHAKADGSILPPARKKADVVNRGQRTIMSAARKGDLELSGQALIERVAKQVERDGFGIRRYVKHLAGADSRQVASRHVPDRVGAGFAGGEAHLGQLPHDGAHILQESKVELDILSGGHMADPGAIGIRQFADAPQLIGCEAAERNFDADHLDTRLPLPIDPMLKAEGSENIARDLARVQPLDLFLKRLDLLEEIRRNGHGFDLVGLAGHRTAHKNLSLDLDNVVSESLAQSEEIFRSSNLTINNVFICEILSDIEPHHPFSSRRGSILAITKSCHHHFLQMWYIKTCSCSNRS